MATTTGSTVLGTVQGLALGLGGGGATGLDIGKIVNVLGDPNGVVTGVPSSGVAWDGENSQHYMFLAATDTWVKLGSIA